MKKSSAKKYVYLFGKGMSDGDASMNELLGGKGANLAEMAKLGLPVLFLRIEIDILSGQENFDQCITRICFL